VQSRRVDESVQVAFGKALRYFRAKAKLSQEGLAAKANVHRNYVGNVERGEKNVCLRTIWNLADALEVAPNGLMREAERQRRLG
jgi:transcriptional regulator with XRE-family HTH domain